MARRLIEFLWLSLLAVALGRVVAAQETSSAALPAAPHDWESRATLDATTSRASSGRRIIVGPPIARRTESGDVLVEPMVNVTLDGEPLPESATLFGHIRPIPFPRDSLLTATQPAPNSVSSPEILPPVPPATAGDPWLLPGEVPMPSGPPLPPAADPLFDELVETVYAPHGFCPDCNRPLAAKRSCIDSWRRLFGCDSECGDCCCTPWQRLFGLGVHRSSCDIGIGHERVMLAPMLLDLTQPFNHVRTRFDLVMDVSTPDRAEYFWARSGRGPNSAGEVVDYQDIRFYSEIAPAPNMGVFTEIPIRILDPVFNSNTAGLADMNAGTRVVIVDGTYWQITHVFRTHINTGAVTKGLSAGHVSLEPGVLARYQWTPTTYLHGELTYIFPVGADPAFAGQILKYGIGLSRVGYETDTFAIIPTIEFLGMTFLDGQKTLPDGLAVDLDGESVGTIMTGTRYVLGPAGELGLFELAIGVGAGFGVGWYDGLGRIDLRWSY